jgi:hypothetical protein
VAALLLLILLVAAGLGVGYTTGLIRIGQTDSAVATGDSSQGNGNGEPSADLHRGATQDSNTDANDEENGGSAVSRSKEMTDDRGDDRGTARQSPPVTDNKAAAPDLDPSMVRPAVVQKAPAQEAPPDPAQAAKFRASLAAARKALGERAMEDAEARIAEAGELAVSQEQRWLVSGFEALATHVNSFWEAVREGMKGLEEAGELTVGSTLVSVVEANEDRLVIRVNGQNRRYSPDNLPAGVAAAIAKKWFDDRPENKVILGAFYFVDPRTDLADARRLWEEAAGGGVDVKDLLALLPIAASESAVKSP